GAVVDLATSQAGGGGVGARLRDRAAGQPVAAAAPTGRPPATAPLRLNRTRRTWHASDHLPDPAGLPLDAAGRSRRNACHPARRRESDGCERWSLVGQGVGAWSDAGGSATSCPSQGPAACRIVFISTSA